MTAPKRKYTIVAHDSENPLVISTESQEHHHHGDGGGKKSKSSSSSRWPGDVSNTLQRLTSKTKSKSIGECLTLNHLSDEVILTILTYITKASIVAFGQSCRRFRALAYHPTLWRRVDMSYKRIDNQQLNSLLQRGTITLKMFQTTVNGTFMKLTNPSALRHLDLTLAVISEDLLVNLLGSCRSLRKLSLELMPLTGRIVEKILLNEQLDTLNLTMCTGLTFDNCRALTSKLTLLRNLNISWTELSFESVQHLCETLPRSIEQLNISGQRYTLTDDCIQSLVRRTLRLRILDISDSALITDQSIVYLRQHSRLLSHLSASRCYYLTATALVTLKLLPAFTALDIFGTLAPISLQTLYDEFSPRIHLNVCQISTIARPTTGIQRTSIWGLRTRL